MVSPNVRTLLLVTTHFTILALILGASFFSRNLDLTFLLVLAAIESALLGENVFAQLRNNPINITLGGDNETSQNNGD